jgi:hypothetical protein
VTPVDAVLLAALLAVVGGLAWRRLRPPRRGPTARRLLVPFTRGDLDPTVLDAALRIARAEEATIVPAYLLVVPLRYAEDSPLRQEVAVAMPLLEAVEHAALRAGVPVDARIEKGRTPTHALRRLWDVERFDRVLVPAPSAPRAGGFSAKDLSWILTEAPIETLVLKPGPSGNGHEGGESNITTRAGMV